MSGGFFQSDVSIIITDYHLVRPFSCFMQIFFDNLLKQQLRGRLFLHLLHNYTGGCSETKVFCFELWFYSD